MFVWKFGLEILLMMLIDSGPIQLAFGERMAEATQKHCQDMWVGLMHTSMLNTFVVSWCMVVYGYQTWPLARTFCPGLWLRLEVDPDLTDPELFRQLFCQKPGIQGLGDLWVDVPWWDLC